MGIFKNKFFSIAGQKERLVNAAKTISSAITPGGSKPVSTLNPTSKVGKFLNKAMETAAQHPFATAAVGAVAAKPKVAVAAVKEVAKGATNVVKKITSSTAGKVATAAATPVAINKIVPTTNPTNIVMPGQPAGSTAPVAGQPTNGGMYIPPQDGTAGSVPGAQSNGVGAGGATDLVQKVVKTNIYQKEPNMQPSSPLQDYIGQETQGMQNFSDVGSPTNSLARLNKRQGLVRSSNMSRIKIKTRKARSRKKYTKKATGRSKKAPSHSKGHFGSEAQFKKRGGFKVHYTKNGQPFIILKSGKARFIKKNRR